MPYPIIYAAVTNHGFGHATRTASVLAEVKRLCPEVVIAFVTTAPRWLLDSYMRQDFIHRPIALDIGIIQSDSITMDKDATLEKLRQIRENSRKTIASEVTFLRQNRVGLVIGDIPPIAAAIARAADVPCWMISNFGWDFIYRAWGGDFVAEADWIADRFHECDQLFRLPFNEPMSAFPKIVDVGLTGGSPHFSEADLRSKFNLTAPPERTAILTFGGLGLAQIPYHNLDRFPDWQFITFDRQAPDLPNLIKVNDSQYRPVDFMPVCSRVVSKPGYSTFAESCRMGVPLVTITRDDFAEAAVLIAGMQNHHPHQILQPEEFFQGDWSFLNRAPDPPKTNQPAAKDGNETIAKAILNYLFS